jgi:hypothetical protein
MRSKASCWLGPLERKIFAFKKKNSMICLVQVGQQWVDGSYYYYLPKLLQDTASSSDTEASNGHAGGTCALHTVGDFMCF